MIKDFLSKIARTKNQETRHTNMLVFADWLEEQGDLDEATGWRWIVENKYVPYKPVYGVIGSDGIRRDLDRWEIKEGTQRLPKDKHWRYVLKNLGRHDNRFNPVSQAWGNTDAMFDSRIATERAVAVLMGLYLSGKELKVGWE